MRKYFTWRCIKLHLVVLVLVPGFLVAGWWQYNVARGGNDLSWVYTVEWPFFAVYTAYIWWKLIHDESTPFDRLWVAKQRAAADAEGKPLHEIPGWATDKALSREVHRASREAARHPALSGPRLRTLHVQALEPRALMPGGPDGAEELDPTSVPSEAILDDNLDDDLRGDQPDQHRGDHLDRLGPVTDARVLEVKANIDEELEAYNRYLFDLSRSGPPKRWGSRGSRRRAAPLDVNGTPTPVPARQMPALSPTDEET